MNLFLTGFMGSGKTTVGRSLAQKLGLPYLDTDVVIEAEAGKPISQIFADHGEAAFRQMERDLCARLPDCHVIALGGGTFMDPENRDVFMKRGVTVFLEWPFSVLADRMSGDPNRPLSADPKRMAELYQLRLPTYRLADIVWKSAAPHRTTPAEVASQVADLVQVHTDMDFKKS